MGCSSSTQTQAQGGNKPPAKTVETNGPMKSDDIETIPDQTKLVPLTENESSTNGIPPKEEQVEGKFEEDDEANKHEEIVSEEPDTKEGETGHPEDAAATEMYVMTPVEE